MLTGTVVITAAQWGWFAAAAVGGYLIGAINPATLIAKARGIDIHASGSGNPGATNVARVLGKRTGLIVGLLDVCKGLIPVLIFSWLGGPGAGEIAGFMAVVGHITSPFLRGRGGKGVATTAGALLGVQPWWLIPVLVCFAVTFLLVKRMGLASVAGAIGLIGVALIDRNTLSKSLFGVVLGLLIVFRHRSNIGAAIRAWRNPPAADQ